MEQHPSQDRYRLILMKDGERHVALTSLKDFAESTLTRFIQQRRHYPYQEEDPERKIKPWDLPTVISAYDLPERRAIKLGLEVHYLQSAPYHCRELRPYDPQDQQSKTVPEQLEILCAECKVEQPIPGIVSRLYAVQEEFQRLSKEEQKAQAASYAQRAENELIAGSRT